MNPSRPSLPLPFHPPSEPSSISPLRRVDASIEFQAGLADVTLRFHWLHPGPHVLHLLHSIPLPAQAVLYHTECSIHSQNLPTRRLTVPNARALRHSPQFRDRTCVQVRRLLPTRADLSIDFLPPFCPLDISVSFLLPVEFRGAVAEFILPLCPPVLPGLTPPRSTPPHPSLHPPRLPASHPHATQLTIHGRLLDPLQSCQLIESPSHPLLVLNQHQEQSFSLARQPSHPQADLVLRWRNADPLPGHARVWSDGRDPVAHALLHLATPLPPAPSSPPKIRPFHILIDASGSLRGRPWSQACLTVRARLAQLPPATPVSVAVFQASLTWILPPTRTAHETVTDGRWYARLERFLPQGLGSPEVALSSWVQSLLSVKDHPPGQSGHLEWLTDGEFLPPHVSLAHLLQDTPFSLSCLLLGGHPGGSGFPSWPEHPRVQQQILAPYDTPETWVLRHPAPPPEPILTHLHLSRPWIPLSSLPLMLRPGEAHSLILTGPSHLASLQLHGRNLQGNRRLLPIAVSSNVIPAISLLAQAIAHSRRLLLTNPPVCTPSKDPAADPIPLFPNLVDIGFLPGPPVSGSTRYLVQPALEPQILSDPNSPYPPLPPLDPLRESSVLTPPSLPTHRITPASRHPYRRRCRKDSPLPTCSI